MKLQQLHLIVHEKHVDEGERKTNRNYVYLLDSFEVCTVYVSLFFFLKIV